MNSLAELGPQVDAIIFCSVLDSEGVQQPVRFLVDTGAEISMLSDRVIAALPSISEETIELAGVFSAPELREVHTLTIHLVLTDGSTWTLADAPLTSMPNSNDGVDGLLGRDVLSHLRLSYDGAAGTFSLLASDQTKGATSAGPPFLRRR